MGIVKNIRKSLSDILMPKPAQTMDQIQQRLQLLTGYTPAFSSFEGGLYELDLVRSCIHSFATHVSKLSPVVQGSEGSKLERMLQSKPNPLQDTTKFLYSMATMLMAFNGVLVIPILDKSATTVEGYFPTSASGAEIVHHQGELYLRYTSISGERSAIELNKCGIITQMMLKDPVFGETNRALSPVLETLHTQNEGLQEGTKSSATIRFMGKLNLALQPDDIEFERQRFVKNNFGPDNGGLMLFDNRYDNVTQINSTPFIADPEQQKLIEERVYTYFGTNKKILQNNFTSAEWNSYYEGRIEPFALQAALVLTNMTFSERERAFGNQIFLSSNRMQYLTTNEKLEVVKNLFDRGMLTQNQGLEIFNLPTLGGEGDKRFIRGEYVNRDPSENEGRPTEEPETIAEPESEVVDG